VPGLVASHDIRPGDGVAIMTCSMSKGHPTATHTCTRRLIPVEVHLFYIPGPSYGYSHLYEMPHTCCGAAVTC